MANPEQSGGAKLRGPVLNRAGRAAEEVREVDANVGLRVWALCQKPRRFRVLCPLVPSSAAGERGYTALELVVVISLVGILLVVGLPGIRGALAREEIDGWVRAIVHEISAAQQAALTRRASVTAAFDGSTFTVVAPGVGALRTETLPSHISFGGGLQAVTFDRRGEPSGDMTITVTSSRAGKTYTITIQPGTGRVDYNG